MSLTAFVTSLDGMDDAVKALYVEHEKGDGTKGFIVDIDSVDGIELSDTKGLRSALEGERSTVAEQKTTINTGVDALKAFKELGTPEEITAKIEEAAKAGSKGDFDAEAERKKMETVYQEKYDGLSKEIDTLKDAKRDSDVRNMISKAIETGLADSDLEIMPGAGDTIQQKMRTMIAFDDDGKVFIKNDKGQPSLAAGSSSERMGLGEAFEVFAKDKSNQFMFKGENNGGADLTPPSGGGSTGSLTAEKFQKMEVTERNAIFEKDPDKYRSLVAAEKKLPRKKPLYERIKE